MTFKSWRLPSVLLSANPETDHIHRSNTPEDLTRHWCSRAVAHLADWQEDNRVEVTTGTPALLSIAAVEPDLDPFDGMPDGIVTTPGRDPVKILGAIRSRAGYKLSDYRVAPARSSRVRPDSYVRYCTVIPPLETPWGLIPPLHCIIDDPASAPLAASPRRLARARWEEHVQSSLWDRIPAAAEAVLKAIPFLPRNTTHTRVGRGTPDAPAYRPPLPPDIPAEPWPGTSAAIYSVPGVTYRTLAGQPVPVPPVRIVALSADEALTYWKAHARTYGADHTAQQRQRMPRGTIRLGTESLPHGCNLGVIDDGLPPPPPDQPPPDPNHRHPAAPPQRGRGRPPGSKDRAPRTRRGKRQTTTFTIGDMNIMRAAGQTTNPKTTDI